MFDTLTARLRAGRSHTRRRLLVHRRWWAALAAGLAVWLGISATAAPPPDTVTVWTVSNEIVAGEPIRGEALSRVQFLPDSVPDGAVRDIRPLLGRAAARTIGAGQALTDADALGEQWVHAQNQSVLPVRISDAAVVGLLRPGDRVDLLATSASGATGAAGVARVIARDARVVLIPRQSASPSTASLPGRLVLMAIPPDHVPDVTRAAAGEFLSVAWSR